MRDIVKKFVPAVKLMMACLLVGAAKLLGIKWNPYIAGKKDADD